MPEGLARQVATIAQKLRGLGLYKPPGVAETIDWAVALHTLGAGSIDGGLARATLGTVLKYREDTERVTEGMLAEMATGADPR